MTVWKAIVLSSALALAGCAASAPPIDVAFPKEAPQYPGSPASVYSRIARGAMACWFAPDGPLGRRYIWHATAEPEARGGAAEIVVHERAEDNYRGRKALVVRIINRDGGSAVATDALKLPEPLAVRLKADVVTWAQGAEGCGTDSAAVATVATGDPAGAVTASTPPAASVAVPASAKPGSTMTKASK